MFNQQTVYVNTGRRRGCGCTTVIAWIIIIMVIIFIISHI